MPNGDIKSAPTRHSTSTTAITAPPPAASGAIIVRMADTAPRRADAAALTTGLSTVAAVHLTAPVACTARCRAWTAARAACCTVRVECPPAWAACLGVSAAFTV